MIRITALILTVITGFSALVYEITWQKFLAVLLGSHAEATAVVLGLFLGGLSYGYVLFGRISRRLASDGDGSGASRRLLSTYGLVEIGIGVYALLFPLLFRLIHGLSVITPRSTEWVAFPIDVILAAVLIGPPATLMGATIPLLTQALSTSLADATRFHAFVYAFNTAGAFFGAVGAGFFLIPRLGLSGVMMVMGLVNLASGAAFVLLGRLHRREAWVEKEAAEGVAESPPARVQAYAAVALLAGFAMMTLQTAANRVGSLAVGASPFTFAIVVATFVLCIAIGSFAVSALPRIPRGLLPVSQWVLVVYLILLDPRVLDSQYWAHVIRASFRDYPALAYPYHLTTLAALVLVLIVPIALSGATLPLIFHRLRSELGGLGRVAGRIYGWNTLGSLLGALLGGYALLFWLNLHDIYRLAVVILAVGAAILTARIFRRGPVLAGIGLVLVTGIVLALPAWPKKRLATGTFRTRTPTAFTFAGPEKFFEDYLSSLPEGDPVVFHEDGPTATVAVLKTSDDGLALIINGKPDSAIPGDGKTTGLLGVLPALVSGECRNAFVVGYGTGKTAASLAAIDSVQEVVVSEISPGVIHAAPKFDPLNGGASVNAKIRVVRGDAYRELLNSPRRFDVVVSAPSNPWVSGIEMLYSLEFLQAARERLTPGGVHAQWIHIYETDDSTLDLVLNTYRKVFDQVAVWIGGPRDLILLGFPERGRPLDLDRIEQRWDSPDYRSVFRSIGIDSMVEVLSHEAMPLGVLQHVELPPELHTLLRPTLNHRAALAFFVGGRARLPSSVSSAAADAGARNSLLRRYREQQGGGLSDEDWARAVEEVCGLDSASCTTFFGAWFHERPGSSVLEQSLARARGASPGLAQALTAANLARVASLYQPDATRGFEPSYELANRVLETFTTFYHHAFPFDPEALRGPWLRCTDLRCAADRERALATGLSSSAGFSGSAPASR